jgi:hypothetical protein
VSSCRAVGVSISAGGADRTLIYRWNGSNWAIASSPTPAGSISMGMAGVSCVSATECEAVGAYAMSGQPETTFAERWNGSTWEIVGMPQPGSSRTVQAVSCSSAAGCTAVGGSTSASFTSTWVARWNGATWSTESSPNPTKTPVETRLEDVSCPAATACMAVGTNRARHQAVAERWDGVKWSVVSVPKPGGATGTYFEDVACPSTTNCFAVGEAWWSNGTTTPLIERWDGSGWSIMTAGNPSGSAYTSLLGVSCTSTTNCFAVGQHSSGGTKTLVERWNGSNWSVVSSPNAPGSTGSILQAVSCVSSSDCTAVGFYDNASFNELTLIERWNGSTWTVVGSPNRTGATPQNFLVDVSCVSASYCVAVGQSGAPDGSLVRSLAERWNGTSWAIMSSVNPAGAKGTSLRGVSCTSSTSCIAVGLSAAVFGCGCEDYPTSPEPSLAERWNGTSWSIEATPNPAGSVVSALNGVACLNDTECRAVGYWTNGPMAKTLTEFRS